MANIFNPTAPAIADPVTPDVSGKARAIVQQGEVQSQVGKAVATLGNAALAGYGIALEDSLTKNVESLAAMTTNEDMVGVQAESAGIQGATIFKEDQKKQEKPAAFTEFVGALDIFKEARAQNRLTPEQATAYISALQKKYIAMYPGMASDFRRATLSAAERATYGNKALYDLLSATHKDNQAQKDAAKLEYDLKDYAAKHIPEAVDTKTGLWTSDYAHKLAEESRMRYFQLVEQRDMSGAQMSLVEDNRKLKGYAVKDKITAETALSIERVRNVIGIEGHKLRGLPANRDNVIEEAKSMQHITEAFNDYDSYLTAQKALYIKANPAQADVIEDIFKNKAAELAHMRDVYSHPPLAKMYADMVDATGKQKELQQAYLTSLSGYALIVKDPTMLLNLMNQLKPLIQKGVDIYAADEALTPEDRRIRDEALLSAGVTPDQVDYLKTINIRGVDQALADQKSIEGTYLVQPETGKIAPTNTLIAERDRGNKTAGQVLHFFDENQSPAPPVGKPLSANVAQAVMRRSVLAAGDTETISRPEQAITTLQRVNRDMVAMDRMPQHYSDSEMNVLKNNYVDTCLNVLSSTTKYGTTTAYSPMSFLRTNQDNYKIKYDEGTHTYSFDGPIQGTPAFVRDAKLALNSVNLAITTMDKLGNDAVSNPTNRDVYDIYSIDDMLAEQRTKKTTTAPKTNTESAPAKPQQSDESKQQINDLKTENENLKKQMYELQTKVSAQPSQQPTTVNVHIKSGDKQVTRDSDGNIIAITEAPPRVTTH